MYTFRLTEEIARWAFEVICKQHPDWFIAFTNPTAGPWKTIKCTDHYGNVGEVFRFELEETRPDILLVNDTLRLTMILEAKDSLSKLAAGNQAEKSIQVVQQLSSILKSRLANPYWGIRAKYPILTGLLWGAGTPSTRTQREEVFDLYHEKLCKYGDLESRVLIGVETRRSGAGLFCAICGKFYDGFPSDSTRLKRLADSFGLPVIS